MGVNIVKLANGETLVDMSAATATAASVLEGYTAFGADGNLIRGTATAGIPYAVGRKITVTLPVSGWTASGNVYAQRVTANVSASEKSIVQVLLSDDLETRAAELEVDENMSKVELLDGSVLVEVSELPEVEFTLEISIINGLAASTKTAVMCLNGKPLVITLSADAWTMSGDSYTQTVAVDGLTDGIVFGDILLDDTDDVADDEISEARNVSKIDVSNGSITATCYEYPPSIDLHYFIKIFNKE